MRVHTSIWARPHLLRSLAGATLAATALSLWVGLGATPTAQAACFPSPCPSKVTFETYPSLDPLFPNYTKVGDRVTDQYKALGVTFSTASPAAYPLEIEAPLPGTQSPPRALGMWRYLATARTDTWSIQGSCTTAGSRLGRTPSIKILFTTPRKAVSLYTGLRRPVSVAVHAVLRANTGLSSTTTMPSTGIRNPVTVAAATASISSVELYFEQDRCSSVAATVPLPGMDDLSWK